MKTLYFISITFLFFLCSCNSETITSGQKVIFGIHEIVQMSEISHAVIDTLITMNIQIENNQQQPVVGYISKTDSIAFQIDLSKQNLKLVRTVYPVDKEQKYCAVVAIRPNSVIDNSCIKKTKVNGKNVEIYFNLEGANKWSDLTKQIIGKPVAFIIDNQIYAMPEINSEIRNGVVLILTLNEIVANRISESLNSGISD